MNEFSEWIWKIKYVTIFVYFWFAGQHSIHWATPTRAYFFFHYQEKFIEIFYVASPGPFWWPYYGCWKRSILYFLGIEYTLIYVPYKCYLGLLYNYLFCQFIFLFFNFNFLLLFNYSCVPFLPIPPPHPSWTPLPPPPPPSKKKGN